jgi:hypothetical protein
MTLKIFLLDRKTKSEKNTILEEKKSLLSFLLEKKKEIEEKLKRKLANYSNLVCLEFENNKIKEFFLKKINVNDFKLGKILLKNNLIYFYLYQSNFRIYFVLDINKINNNQDIDFLIYNTDITAQQKTIIDYDEILLPIVYENWKPKTNIFCYLLDDNNFLTVTIKDQKLKPIENILRIKNPILLNYLFFIALHYINKYLQNKNFTINWLRQEDKNYKLILKPHLNGEPFEIEYNVEEFLNQKINDDYWQNLDKKQYYDLAKKLLPFAIIYAYFKTNKYLIFKNWKTYLKDFLFYAYLKDYINPIFKNWKTYLKNFQFYTYLKDYLNQKAVFYVKWREDIYEIKNNWELECSCKWFKFNKNCWHLRFIKFLKILWRLIKVDVSLWKQFERYEIKPTSNVYKNWWDEIDLEEIEKFYFLNSTIEKFYERIKEYEKRGYKVSIEEPGKVEVIEFKDGMYKFEGNKAKKNYAAKIIGEDNKYIFKREFINQKENFSRSGKNRTNVIYKSVLKKGDIIEIVENSIKHIYKKFYVFDGEKLKRIAFVEK